MLALLWAYDASYMLIQSTIRACFGFWGRASASYHHTFVVLDDVDGLKVEARIVLRVTRRGDVAQGKPYAFFAMTYRGEA